MPQLGSGLKMEKYECVATLEGHENEVKAVDWACSGSLLATALEPNLWIWEGMGFIARLYGLF
jgi:WD40 repeat protein